MWAGERFPLAARVILDAKGVFVRAVRTLQQLWWSLWASFQEDEGEENVVADPPALQGNIIVVFLSRGNFKESRKDENQHTVRLWPGNGCNYV